MGAFPAWNTSDIRAFVGVSGAYDLDGLAEHLHQRGLYKSMFGKIMSIDGVPSLTALSPLAAAQVRIIPSIIPAFNTLSALAAAQCILSVIPAFNP